MEHPSFIDSSPYADLPIPPGTERAWAAGFFDGEGHIRASYGRYLLLNVVQTETTTLERFRVAVGGYGNIYARNGARPANWTLSYCLQIGALAEVRHAVLLMWEYLSGPKRRQITEAFAHRGAYRATWPANLKHGGQKLSNEQVGEIRQRLADGQAQFAIARLYDVSQSAISQIKLGKRRV